MKTPEEIKKALECRAREDMRTGCRVCPYYDGKVCEGMVARDALVYIEQLEEAVSLMKIQMRGDCGTCKHDRGRDMTVCGKCLASKEYHPLWEYEGLPEVKSHDKSV